MADDFDLDLDDFGIEIDSADSSSYELEQTTHRSEMRILIIDPTHPDSQLKRQLELSGFACSQVDTGGQAIQAIAAGEFSAIFFVASGDDDDWIRFIVSGVNMRFEGFPCAVLARTPVPAEQERLRSLGLDLVIPSPIPDPGELGRLLDDLLGLQATPSADQASSPSELALLKRRLRDAEEAERLKSEELDQVKNQFLLAINEVSQKTTESTGLRSEVSILRDRSVVMRERLDSAKLEILALKQQNAKLLGGKVETPALSLEQGKSSRQLQELKGLLAALLPFDQALEQALEFLDELAIVSGPRAQLLQRHLRQLKMMRQVFARIRTRLATADK